ncbi:MAG: hypothetical protein AAFQ11_09150, partial [Pseudomonadota bacterium]
MSRSIEGAIACQLCEINGVWWKLRQASGGFCTAADQLRLSCIGFALARTYGLGSGLRGGGTRERLVQSGMLWRNAQSKRLR